MLSKKIDLHIHSKYSPDGQYPPLEIMGMVEKVGLGAISITDHDTTGAYRDLENYDGEVEIITGVEMTTLMGEMSVHLLGYLMDPFNSMLIYVLEKLEDARQKQSRMRVEKLRSLGFQFTDEDVNKYARGNVAVGPIFGMAILNDPRNDDDPRLLPYRKGGERSTAPYYLFDKDFLQEGKPAYVPVDRISTVDAIHLLRDINGAPVLAHPGEKFTPKNDIELIENLRNEGMVGIEVWCGYHNKEDESAFYKLAKELSLIPTSGSDFHGPAVKPHISLGEVGVGNYSTVEKLREAVYA
jgi:hypothetical protein